MDAAKDFGYNFDPEKNKRPGSREKRPRINDDDRLPRRKKNKASHKRRNGLLTREETDHILVSRK